MNICRGPRGLNRCFAVAQRLSRPVQPLYHHHHLLHNGRRPASTSSALDRVAQAAQSLVRSAPPTAEPPVPVHKVAEAASALHAFQISPKKVKPLHYTESSSWQPLGKNASPPSLAPGDAVTLVSWGLFTGPDWATFDAAAVLEQLKLVLGSQPQRVAIMLQEVNHPFRTAIMNDPWVQQNLLVFSPDTPTNDRFCLTMVSKGLGPAAGLDIIPGVLVVDIPILGGGGSSNSSRPKSLRLCNMRLSIKNSFIGSRRRFKQLTLISQLLKGQEAAANTEIVAAVAAGRASSSRCAELPFHGAPEVDLKDVWDDSPPPVGGAPPRPGRLDWDDDIEKPAGARMDKFLYTGSVETFAVDTQGKRIAGKLGRLVGESASGFGLWKPVSNSRPGWPRFISKTEADRLQEGGETISSVGPEVPETVSSSGMAVGIKILGVS